MKINMHLIADPLSSGALRSWGVVAGQGLAHEGYPIKMQPVVISAPAAQLPRDYADHWMMMSSYVAADCMPCEYLFKGYTLLRMGKLVQRGAWAAHAYQAPLAFGRKPPVDFDGHGDPSPTR